MCYITRNKTAALFVPAMEQLLLWRVTSSVPEMSCGTPALQTLTSGHTHTHLLNQASCFWMTSLYILLGCNNDNEFSLSSISCFVSQLSVMLSIWCVCGWVTVVLRSLLFSTFPSFLIVLCGTANSISLIPSRSKASMATTDTDTLNS